MKKKVVEEMVATDGYSRADAERAFDTVFSAVALVARRDSVVSVPQFGKFIVKHRAERTGRNPATGETIRIAGRNMLTFKASKVLSAVL